MACKYFATTDFNMSIIRKIDVLTVLKFRENFIARNLSNVSEMFDEFLPFVRLAGLSVNLDFNLPSSMDVVMMPNSMVMKRLFWLQNHFFEKLRYALPQRSEKSCLRRSPTRAFSIILIWRGLASPFNVNKHFDFFHVDIFLVFGMGGLSAH